MGRHNTTRHRRRQPFGWALVLTAAGAALIGWVLLGSGEAATYAAETEPELGNLQGRYALVSDDKASSAVAVRFGAAPGPCQTAYDAVIQDPRINEYEADNMFDGTWPHPSAGPITVYFATNGLPADYTTMTEDAVAEWNKLPCVDARTATTCPAATNCVTSMLENVRDNYYGYYDPIYDGYSNVMQRGTIVYNRYLQDPTTQANRYNTVLHEIGHALGLPHRATVPAIMSYAEPEEVKNLVDIIDDHNLKVRHGQSIIYSNGAAMTAISNSQLDPANAVPGIRVYD